MHLRTDSRASELSAPVGSRRSWWWLGLILISVGLLAWVAFLYLGLRAHRWRWLVWAALYLALAVTSVAVLDVSDSGAWSFIGTVLLLGLWVGSFTHGLTIRREARARLIFASRLRRERALQLERELAGRLARESAPAPATVPPTDVGREEMVEVVSTEAAPWPKSVEEPLPEGPRKAAASVVRERGFRAAWRFYREHFWTVLTLSLGFYIVMAGLAALALVELGLLALLAWLYLLLVSIFWLQAPLARLMENIRTGRPKAGARRTLAELGPQLGSITGGSFLAAVAVYVASSMFLLPGLFLLARFALLIPVIVIERRGAFRAFARSNRLVRGHTGRVVAEVVVSAILFVIVWTIALVLLGSGLPLWASLVFFVLVLAFGTPMIPLMRILSYYDLLELAQDDKRTRPVDAQPESA